MAVVPKGYIPEDDPRVSPVGHAAPPWLVNYADLMTELVCFFVILYALSAALNKDFQEKRVEIDENLKKGNVATGEIKVTRDGMQITVRPLEGDTSERENLFFESGRAEMTPTMKSVLDSISDDLYELHLKHEIIVEGHTDDRRLLPGSQYKDNWELSTARALSVVRYLVEDKGFKARNLAAVGYGPHHPVVRNDTAANQAQNRRVVFFVKVGKPYVPPWEREKAESEEGAGGAAPGEGGESARAP